MCARLLYLTWLVSIDLCRRPRLLEHRIRCDSSKTNPTIAYHDRHSFVSGRRRCHGQHAPSKAGYDHADKHFSSGPIMRGVQVEALVIMKIIKHCSGNFPTTATGSLVGMDVGGILQITNCFPFPTVDASNADAREESIQNAAAAAPRAKSNVSYQNEMIKMLKEVNVDANSVGWYTSTIMGNFVTINTVENQFFYQKEMNERTVALVYDVSRSTQGSFNLRAFRLSPLFMSSFRENKFTTERLVDPLYHFERALLIQLICSLQKSGLRYQDILSELPVTVHNSHLLTSFLHQIPSPPSSTTLAFPPSLAALTTSPSSTTPRLPMESNFDTLDLSLDPFLEKNCDLLLDSLESHHIETNNASYYQRSLAREQAKIAAWQAKRKAENAARTASKQPLLPEDEWQRLFKLPQEPSRLEMMLNSGQVEQYARQVDGFAGTVSGKMFAVKGNLLREEV